MGVIVNFAPEEDVLSVHDAVELVPAAAIEVNEAQVARGHEREEGTVRAGCEELRVFRVDSNPISGGQLFGRASMIEEGPRRDAGANDGMA